MIKFSELENKFDQVERELDVTPFDDLASADSPTLDANQWYQSACRLIENVFGKVSNEEKLILSEGEDLIEEIVQACLGGILPQELLIHALHGKLSDSFLVANAVNVTVFAVLMGTTLGLPRERLVELGLAALLHDIGKIRMPEEILYKKENLTGKELALLQRYPYESFDILHDLGAEYFYLAECALHVNERLDGSGYPQGLKGDEINSYAQIIGILDIYETHTHSRPHRPKLTHFEAMKEIIKTQKPKFHRQLLKVFINTFALFPLHSLVKLNSGAIGRVIKTFQDQPLRPMIEVIVDARKKRMQVPRKLDLREQSILYILEAASEENFNN